MMSIHKHRRDKTGEANQNHKQGDETSAKHRFSLYARIQSNSSVFPLPVDKAFAQACAFVSLF
jgi:hypothetical protein